MKYMIAAAALAAMSGPVWAQDAAPWGAAEVDAYVAVNRPRAATEVADPFAVPAAAPAPASQVLLRSSVYMSGAEPAPTSDFRYTAVWKYDPATQTMELKTYRPSAGTLLSLETQGVTIPGLASYQRPNMAGIDTFTDRKTEDAGEGQNAYGARVDMRRITIENRGIGEIRSSIVDDAGPPVPRGQYSYDHSFTIAPEDARALTQNLELQIIAEPVAWAPNKWIICGESYSGATVRNPVILSTSGCYLTARFDTFRFVDTRDGTVIKEWSRPARR